MTTERSNPIKVLVPLDGSALALQAIPYASALAGSSGSLIFTSIVPVAEPKRDERGWTMPLTEQDQDRVASRAAEYLEQIAERWVNGHGPAHVVVSAGDAAEEILRIAREEAVDVIAIASHGRGAIGRWRFGSVADRISRSADIPVLVVRPVDGEAELDDGRIGRFVVALDGSERAMRALTVVRRIARETGDAVHLISVVVAPDAVAVPLPWMGPPVVGYDTGETLISLERKAVDDLTLLANELNDEGIATTFTVAVGEPFQMIDDVAHPHDVIALTTHGRSGIERWALGSLAEKLVRNARAPVLIVNARSE
ncbi:MAG: universal stress protein [Thermomicrobiales bacterium]|jgi:nucleotide-binding universal stress UspA family protein|nr:universal stress protein [Thermomicrobiales bacterium]